MCWAVAGTTYIRQLPRYTEREKKRKTNKEKKKKLYLVGISKKEINKEKK